MIRRSLLILVASASLLTMVWGSLLTVKPAYAQNGGKGIGKMDHLLLISRDGRLRLRNPDGQEEILASDVSTDVFRYPSPAPDGRHLAYIANDSRGYALYNVDLVSGERLELYRSPADPPLWFVWSPDSRYIALLVNLSTGGLSVRLIYSDDSQPSEMVAPGNPSYFAWAPDSSALLLHIGGSVFEGGAMLLYHPGSFNAKPIFEDPGISFRTPAWSVDGQNLFYVSQQPVAGRPSLDNIESLLTRVAPDGSGAKALVSEPRSALFFSRAPNSDSIAYINARPRAGARLELFDESFGGSLQLSGGDQQVIGFFWAPDGGGIAYLTIAASGNGLTWNVVDVASGERRELVTFEPGQSFEALLNFFDAYAISLNLWSADSSRLTYAATDGVYVLDVLRGTATRAVDGILGMWIQR